MIREQNLKQFFRKYQWTLPFIGVFFLCISPIYLTVCGFMAISSEVPDYFQQCIDAIFMNIEK